MAMAGDDGSGSDAFCADLAAAAGEPLAATAPRTDRWLLVEAHGQWEPDAIETPGLGDAARERIRAWLAAVPFSRLLLIRRPERRDTAGIHVYAADARPGHESLRCAVVGAHDEIAGLDLEGGGWGEPVAGPLLLVCHHGRRDACCARLGKPLYEALVVATGGGAPGAAAGVGAPAAGGAPSTARAAAVGTAVWQCSHVGGHRFAANVVWLPEGIYLGRVAPGEAAAVVAAAGAGRIPLAHARGRSSLPPAAQAADLALRLQLGLDDLADVAVAGVEEGESGSLVRLVAAGREHAFRVSAQPAPPSVASCGEQPKPLTRLVAVPA